MKPIHKIFPKLILLSLGIVIIIQLLNWVLGRPISFDRDLFVTLLYTALYTVCLYYANAFGFELLDKAFVAERFSKKRMVIGFVSAFFISLSVVFLLRVFEDVIIERQSFSKFLANENPANYLFAILITFFITISLYAFYFYKAYQENKVKEQKIIAGTASAKFESLKNQIDPHFLFNSLNVLSSLIEENPQNAQRFTTSLSKVYRYVLEQKDKELVSVEEELSFAKTYMNLLKMRFENSLFYELPEVISNTEGKVVPLSLQLLLENTVKHNVASEQKPLHIRIFEENDYLVIQNDFQKKEVIQDRHGVGVQNIISRYGIITQRKVIIEQDSSVFAVKIPILTRQVEIMETSHTDDENRFYEAKKRVEDIKGFYGNLWSYIIVIGALAILNLVTYPQYLWFLYPAGGWGVGVLIHGLFIFGTMPFLGRDWEEKKIRQIMDQERSNKWN